MHSIESDLAISTDINWCFAGHFCANLIYRACNISAFGVCIHTRIYLINQMIGRALKYNPTNTKPDKGESRKR